MGRTLGMALSFNGIQAFVVSSTIFRSPLLLIPGVPISIFIVCCIPAGTWQDAANMSAHRFLKIMAECLTQHAITNQKLSSHNHENRCTSGAEMLPQNGSSVITRRWKTKLPELSGAEFSKFGRSNFCLYLYKMYSVNTFQAIFQSLKYFSFICWIWSLGARDSVENLFQFSH